MPFVPPSPQNFIYDPFSLDFDNPFNSTELESDLERRAASGSDLEDVFSFGAENAAGGSSDKEAQSFNFENFMKTIGQLSYSAMFEDNNSKKFTFKPIARKIVENNNPDMLTAQPQRFAG